VSFVRFSSYAGSTQSSGEVRLVGLAPEDVSGRRVLVVDDILDTGRTMRRAKEVMRRAGATETRYCTLLDKPARREVEIAADYVGFPIEDRFVVGYGLDHAERYRALPYIGVLAVSKAEDLR
jgi:hypoxanthine phosphoribosyltransferase